jgi:hypothetical protein
VLLSKMRFDLLKPRNDFNFKRYPSATLVDYIYTKGTPTDVVVKALIYPANRSKNLNFLPEGLRDKRVLRIFTNDLIIQSQTDEDEHGDEFEYDGEDYRVVFVDAWKDVSGFTAYEGYAAKVADIPLEASDD